MTLLLVRHAESSGNFDRTIQGWSDTPPTEEGVRQATLLAARLSALPLEAVYTSPLTRARATAAPVADALGLPLAELEGLRERNYGQAQGLDWAQVSARWPATASHEADWATQVPEAEPLPALQRRALTSIEGLLDRHRDGLALCVSHGGTLSLIVAHCLGLPAGVLPRIRLSNTGITVIEGGSAAPLVRVINDVCHLRDRTRAATEAT